MIDKHLPFAAYRQLQRVNFSTLKALHTSPLHYQHALLEARPDTPALALGRAVHCLALEPDKWGAGFCVWGGADKRTKAGQAEWEAFEAAAGARTILKADDAAAARYMADSIRREAGAYLAEGSAEVSLTWTLQHRGTTAIECKGRTDWLSAAAGILDIKTTRNLSGFGREAASYLMHAQAAWYLDGLRAAVGAVGEELPYRLVAVEKSPPWDCVVYRVPEAVLAQGRALYRGWLDVLVRCQVEGRWPGRAEVLRRGLPPGAELELELPGWASPETEEEADE